VFFDKDIRAGMIQMFAKEVRGFQSGAFYNARCSSRGRAGRPAARHLGGTSAPQDISKQIPAWSIPLRVLFRDANHLAEFWSATSAPVQEAGRGSR